MTDLTYTTEKPTLPGWYWMRWQDSRGAHEEVARIYDWSGDLFNYTMRVSQVHRPTKNKGGE